MTRTSKHLDQLEREIEEYKAYNAQLREDVARLREALKFYADRQNWGRDEWGLPNCIDESPDLNNGGATARAALHEADNEST